MVFDTDKALNLVIPVLVFALVIGTAATAITDNTSLKTRSESLGQADTTGNLSATTAFDNIQTVAAVYNDTVTLVEFLDYNVTSATGLVVVNDSVAPGGANANISINYTYQPDNYVTSSSRDRTMIGLILLFFVVAVIVAISKQRFD